MFKIRLDFGGDDWRSLVIVACFTLALVLILTGRADQLISILADAIQAWRR